jgi:hypothetical protein
MSTLHNGSGFLFMKVGTHANEGFQSILERKRREIEEGGFAMWGYGGGTCHPITTVRPFAESFKMRGSSIHLVMEEMDSRHFAEQIPADEYSINGKEWKAINKSIHQVLGSRYALFIKDIREEDFMLPLTNTKVGVGPSEGRRGDIYIQGRVDKACLILDEVQRPEKEEGAARHIRLVADIVAPYAALLRNVP